MCVEKKVIECISQESKREKKYEKRKHDDSTCEKELLFPISRP